MDEESRSGGVSVLGDPLPEPADVEESAHDAVEAGPSGGPASTVVDAGGPVPAEAPAEEQAAEPTAAEKSAAEELAVQELAVQELTAEELPLAASAEASPAVPVTPPAVARQRPRRARRVVTVAALVLAVALAVSAFATGGSPTVDVDQRFVDTAAAQGHVVDGPERPLVVSAARKICERRESHGTDADRRATALTAEELGAVDQAFGEDARGFMTLALDTYCAN